MATVEVRPQVTGILTNVHFREGQDVKAGDLLFSLDGSSQEATLRQAEAVLTRDVAQARNAAREAIRQDELHQKGLVSDDLRDQARTAAEALSAATNASLAAVQNARLQMSYCSIRSPIDGRTGRVVLDAGNLVKANDIVLVTINQIRPIQVSFVAPQQKLNDIRKYMADGSLEVRASIPESRDKPDIGTLTFVDNAVDAGTGTIRLKGNFPNDDLRLWPGQFVNVALLLAVETNALVLPTLAVQTGQRGPYVFVVNPDLSVSNRAITVERTYEDTAVIASGLVPGERVVLDGQLRLTPDSKVVEATAQPPAGKSGTGKPADGKPADGKSSRKP
jgi:multidrug efflux system membrane fusion protein